MQTIRFYSFKVRETFDLDKIADYFKKTRSLKWSDYIVLDNHLLESTLKRTVKGHEVILYQFGVVTFINFYEDEMRNFLSLIDQIEAIDYTGFAKNYEHFELEVGAFGETLYEDLQTIPHKQITEMIAETTAKSVGLAHIEMALQQLMDQVEPLLIQMSHGRVKVDRRTKRVLGEMISFKYKLAQSVGLFDKPSTSIALKEWHEYILEYFELNDRYIILEGKVDDLKKMLFQYYKFNHAIKDRRLFIFEIVLLTFFPISSLARSGALARFIEWIVHFF
ncbi:RMD1 family protein [Fusibacter ferrireducens]|uniref:RMD1 family protein n=1 Tax=Fusibacter ferrireducens TaxID=2785058 RepID=A0ABR9ZQH3_9FIRM|nr:RMD1 family protein [Fusibacter ferrireducens]MBF4692679.1 RMD1 family protein [Fusibacter ferrireducens]